MTFCPALLHRVLGLIGCLVPKSSLTSDNCRLSLLWIDSDSRVRVSSWENGFFPLLVYIQKSELRNRWPRLSSLHTRRFYQDSRFGRGWGARETSVETFRKPYSTLHPDKRGYYNDNAYGWL